MLRGAGPADFAPSLDLNRLYDEGAVFTAELVGVRAAQTVGKKFRYCVVPMGMILHLPDRSAHDWVCCENSHKLKEVLFKTSVLRAFLTEWHVAGCSRLVLPAPRRLSVPSHRLYGGVQPHLSIVLDALDKKEEIHGRRHEAYVAAMAACEQREGKVARVGADEDVGANATLAQRASGAKEADSEASEAQRGVSLDDAACDLSEAAGSASCGGLGALLEQVQLEMVLDASSVPVFEGPEGADKNASSSAGCGSAGGEEKVVDKVRLRCQWTSGASGIMMNWGGFARGVLEAKNDQLVAADSRRTGTTTGTTTRRTTGTTLGTRKTALGAEAGNREDERGSKRKTGGGAGVDDGQWSCFACGCEWFRVATDAWYKSKNNNWYCPPCASLWITNPKRCRQA